MRYFKAAVTGVGFITHQDRETFAISGFPGDIWGVDGSAASLSWASRVGAQEVSREEAQAVVDGEMATASVELPRVVLP